ncbi:MAG TPA: substrate-binding domain-containing protein [Rhodopila sp.]|nr:substrate-binding domain-containing protein [Rhodopila sp.]
MMPLRVLSTLAVMGAMRDLTAQYERETGTPVEANFAPTVALLDRLRAHDAADIAILTAQGIDDLSREGIIRPGTRSDVALSFVGIAMKTGASRPDIETVAAFRQALLSARSIAYSRIGASGIFFAGLIERLGIAAEVNAKAVIVPSGFTAERVANGEVELAVQQISELMVVPGIEVVGPLPAEIQTVATFSAGILASSERAEASASFLRFLTSPAIAPALRRAGLQPATTAP